MPLHFLFVWFSFSIRMKFIKIYPLLLTLFLPLKFTCSFYIYARVSQLCEVPLETYTLFLRHSPSCLVTARVPVTSLPYCRGGKRLDSREFREKNFLIRVYKRFVSSCTTFQRRKNVLYTEGFSVTKVSKEMRVRTLISTTDRSHAFSLLEIRIFRSTAINTSTNKMILWSRSRGCCHIFYQRCREYTWCNSTCIHNRIFIQLIT